MAITKKTVRVYIRSGRLNSILGIHPLATGPVHNDYHGPMDVPPRHADLGRNDDRSAQDVPPLHADHHHDEDEYTRGSNIGVAHSAPLVILVMKRAFPLSPTVKFTMRTNKLTFTAATLYVGITIPSLSVESLIGATRNYVHSMLSMNQ